MTPTKQKVNFCQFRLQINSLKSQKKTALDNCVRKLMSIMKIEKESILRTDTQRNIFLSGKVLPSAILTAEIKQCWAKTESWQFSPK